MVGRVVKRGGGDVEKGGMGRVVEGGGESGGESGGERGWGEWWKAMEREIIGE